MRGDGSGKSEEPPGIPAPKELSQDLTPKPRYAMCSLSISVAPPAWNGTVSCLCLCTAGDLTNSGVSSSLRPFLAPAAKLITPPSLIPNTLVGTRCQHSHGIELFMSSPPDSESKLWIFYSFVCF